MESKIKSDVAKHYDNRAYGTKNERKFSKIIQLRTFQNYIKATLVNKYTKNGNVVLDLACGKGGDILKWSKAGVKEYHGLGELFTHAAI